MPSRARVLPLLPLLAVLACQPPAPPAPDTAVDEAAITAVRDAEVASLQAGLTDLSYLSADPVLMPPGGGALVGLEAVGTWGRNFATQFAAQVAYGTSNITISGDLAVESYEATLTMTPVAGGNPVTESLKGIHVYRRQADGSWKMSHDIWNPNTAPPM